MGTGIYFKKYNTKSIKILQIWLKKGNTSNMGNQIYFKIAGQVDLDVLIIFTHYPFWPIMQIRKNGGWNLKKFFSSETTVPISTKLCWNEPWVVPFAILDTGRHWRTQVSKGTTQGSFQQSLVEIGTAVSEEKSFF
jgi:hypothetical protein